jgi:hypothetical protein
MTELSANPAIAIGLGADETMFGQQVAIGLGDVYGAADEGALKKVGHCGGVTSAIGHCVSFGIR